jgi:hypothetical protein
MHVVVTIQQDEDIGELKGLILSIRDLISSENVTVFEAPEDLDYPYPLPVVTISENDKARNRLYGSEALEKLRDLAAG